MTGVVVNGDLCSGHGCWPPRRNIGCSSNVFIGGKGAVRVGDAWETHCCPSIPECHSSYQSTGSPNVFVNGLAMARVGDLIACGSVNVSGQGVEAKVFCN